MVTVRQKLGLATKKLKKSTQDAKALCDYQTRKDYEEN